MNFISWIFEHLYILIVIGFALVSFLGKSMKSTERKAPPGKGMPTFGGDHGSRGPSSPSRPSSMEHRQEQRQLQRQDTAGELQRQFPDERRVVMEARRVDEPMNGWTETEEQSKRDSLDNGSTLEDRIRAMEEERRSVLARLDRISNARESGEITDAPEGALQERSTVTAADLRRGVIWAEILGPPRSKRYMGGGRR
ncbi:hypothetical protein NST83_16225 [Paenibacillus sp. FSL R10-2782]|uniref:Uncharacterized protein n=1 Tax=Paenibacillus terrae TaxID=159743 RepID=A0A4U2PV86_9BACL|nr:hypothetical protein [Paenibacillus terrae]TKH42196.1 hypothetical protein C1I60_23210 [Paenibacillus terrae]